MYTVWHVDKYKITFKLVINWTNEILQYIVVSSGLSRTDVPGRGSAVEKHWCRLPNCHVMGRSFYAETASLETFVLI